MTGVTRALLHQGGLPGKWQGRQRFVILLTRFDPDEVVALWEAWLADRLRCRQLWILAIDPELAQRQSPGAEFDGEQPSRRRRRLAREWPPSTPNLHRLAFDGGRLQLLLVPGEPAGSLRRIVATFDLCVLDASVGRALEANPRVARSISRLAAHGAMLVAEPALPEVVNKALEATGFRFEPGPSNGNGGGAATYTPHTPHQAAAKSRRPDERERRAVIVGAGLAGCAAAWALAQQGWRTTVLEREQSIAAAASGNPAGLFHGAINGHDGTHARFNRAAALEAHRAITAAISDGVEGSAAGLLQLLDDRWEVGTMRALLEGLGLPPEHVIACDAASAGARAGIPLAHPAWFHRQGGWVNPAQLARWFLDRGGRRAELRPGVEVTRLQRSSDDGRWELLDPDDRVVETAATVVLANAGGAPLLSGVDWPVNPVRGQLSVYRAEPGRDFDVPRLPISGAGYLVVGPGGRLVFGATSALDDRDPDVRSADHLENVRRLTQLVPSIAAAIDIDRLDGRTAWRSTSRDRLPLIGVVPSDRHAGSGSATDAAGTADRLAAIPRQRGLYVFAALGSRGINWAALGAQILASTITGAPAPVERALLDAVDPARFALRERRRACRSR